MGLLTLIGHMQVSAAAYTSCTLNADSRPIGECSCDKSDRPATLTLVFRMFSPYGLEYRQGQSYYFISEQSRLQSLTAQPPRPASATASRRSAPACARRSG